MFQAGAGEPVGLNPRLLEKKARERRFLEQLLDGSKVEAYDVTVPINATLRE